jgi:hypothetical protein
MTHHRHSLRLFALALSLFLAGHLQAAAPDKAAERAAYLEKIAKAEAIYNKACKNIAGEKIYKTVPNVEGILLMKVRPVTGQKEWGDPYWPGAAFSREAEGDSYIMSFLGYEQATSANGKWLPITHEHRGYINRDYNPKNVSNLPGYRWADVVDEKDGKRYRYTLVKKIVGRLDPSSHNVQVDLRRDPNMDLNVYRTVLDRQPAPDPAPRYAVTYEDHVRPEERELWVASGTVKVLDLKTKEVLGELVRYVMSYVHVASSRNVGPWLTEDWCPGRGGFTAGDATRMFVDQVHIRPRPDHSHSPPARTPPRPDRSPHSIAGPGQGEDGSTSPPPKPPLPPPPAKSSGSERS